MALHPGPRPSQHAWPVRRGDRGWIDGEGVSARRPHGFDWPAKFVRIKQFWLDVFFGGPSATPNRLVLRLDEIAVSKDGRPGCVDPFTDDNTSTHEADLTDLHARGFIEGCSRRLACPEDTLTRAEMAVLLVRVLSLPRPMATTSATTTITGRRRTSSGLPPAGSPWGATGVSSVPRTR